MENEKLPQNFLFGSIGINKPEDVDNLIENLTFEQSFYIITQALEYGRNSNLYSMQETELVSKSLRILHKNIQITE